MILNYFNDINFLLAIKALMKQLQVPINSISDEPTTARQLLEYSYKENDTFNLIGDIYFAGMVDDAAFEENESINPKEIKSDYDGILFFGVELKGRDNSLLPTRSQLAEITRAFNREFHFTPVVVLFKYSNDSKQYISFANCERTEYKQEWREGEKAGKVSILKDIETKNTHRGHLDILRSLKIDRFGKDAINSFDELYKYWQSVFNVKVLNNSFYKELRTWYFWSLKQVKFPNQPKREIFSSDDKHQDAIKEHRGKNVIRLLTRVLFVWFVKEKKLIPEELFDPNYLKENLLNELAPEHELGLFKVEDLNSYYYKAVLQNLFFATLNQEMGKRVFRNEGQNQGVTNLLRYKTFFKNPEKYIELVEGVVPFMNGGLFECLDSEPVPDNSHLIDGFSQRIANDLQVPDFLFFDSDEDVDISEDIGIKNKSYKNAKTRGLFKILESYKFTITENTPIEQEIALDPELLGQVFENLLASYNPETKTTARKQTGSFYTPREIVNYMVDESLIAYLKKELSGGQNEIEDELDNKLHRLFSYDAVNPFKDETLLAQQIIQAIDTCKILDPACGSGAFPMGTLQKMVHVLNKLDPNNEKWKNRQISKANQIDDVSIRDKVIEDIEQAFEKNELDYGRKLYLIENCIYGVDIQAIATQISKLRFFISLIVDQKVDKTQENLGIRPLPNLETKFVAADTLIGIEKETNLFDTEDIRNLENELKIVRQKLFSAKTPPTKRKYREEDKRLRETISNKLQSYGMSTNTAKQLASWNPFDQNATASFFDMEWMFGLKSKFDIVIGNPPYRPIQKYPAETKSLWSQQNLEVFSNSGNIYFLFFERALQFSKQKGIVTLITSNQWMRNKSSIPLRKYFLENTNPLILIDFKGTKIFNNVAVLSNILILEKNLNKNELITCDFKLFDNKSNIKSFIDDNMVLLSNLDENSWLIFDKKKYAIRESVISKGKRIEEWKLSIDYGIKTGFNDAFYLTNKESYDELIKQDPRNNDIIFPMLRGKDLDRYYPNFANIWLINTYNGKSQGRGKSRLNRIDVQNNFPSIYLHLKNYEQKLVKRQDKGVHWTNLRSCDYDRKFRLPKMIFMNMTKDVIFSFDPNGEYYTNQKCFIVTGEKLKYLTAFFNSKIFIYCFKDNFPELLGDVREISKVYFVEIPVLEIPLNEYENKQKPIEVLLDYIVYLKKRGSDDIKEQLMPTYFDQVINGIFYELYFEEELKSESKDILKYLKDLPSIDSLTNDEQKYNICKNVFEEIYSEKSEVRNRLFYMDTITEIALIEGKES